jgi:hypothetical protein
VLESLKIRIAEDEATLKKMLEATPEHTISVLRGQA